MGAWGHKSFDNDSALDWLDGLDDGLAGVRQWFYSGRTVTIRYKTTK